MVFWAYSIGATVKLFLGGFRSCSIRFCSGRYHMFALAPVCVSSFHLVLIYRSSYRKYMFADLNEIACSVFVGHCTQYLNFEQFLNEWQTVSITTWASASIIVSIIEQDSRKILITIRIVVYGYLACVDYTATINGLSEAILASWINRQVNIYQLIRFAPGNVSFINPQFLLRNYYVCIAWQWCIDRKPNYMDWVVYGLQY